MNMIVAGAHPIVQLIGWTLVHFLWQGIAIGIAFAAARSVLSSSSCRARYALGVAALAILALLPVATFAYLYAHLDSNALPDGVGSSVAASTHFASVADIAAGRSLLETLMPWLVAAWCIGVVIMLVRAGRQWLRLSRIAGKFAVSMADLDGVFAALRSRFGIASHVVVRVSRLIDTPMLVGWITPVVLLPTAVAMGFPRAQLELVLAHELGHLRRYDHLVNLAQMIVETLLFYHPVVHWISREVRDQRELCCDQLVVKMMAADSRRYARALASLEEVRHSSRLVLAASGGELVERVRRLVGSPAGMPLQQSAPSRLGPLALTTTVVVLCAMVARRVDAPTLLLDHIALTWPTPHTRLVDSLFAGHVLLSKAPPIAPIDLRPTTVKPVPKLFVQNEQAHSPQRVLNRAVEPAVVERLSSDSSPVATAVPVAASRSTPRSMEAPTPIVAAPEPKAIAAPPEVHAAPPTRLRAIRTPRPQFPDWSHVGIARLYVSFSIAADGSVRNVQAKGRVPSTFASAATAAISQWRFDPSSVSNLAERFTQSFVFEVAHGGRDANDECVRVTGSMICRNPGDADALAGTRVQPRG